MTVSELPVSSTKADQSSKESQEPTMVRISVATEETPKRTGVYPIAELTYWSSTIRAALDNPGNDTVPHVSQSGLDYDGKAFVVLKDLSQELYFSSINSIMKTSQIPGSREYRGKKATIPSTLDLFKTAMIYRAGVYLGTEYISRIALSIMQRKITSVVSREEANKIYHYFGPNTIPRQMVIESIAEDCLSGVFDERQDRNKVWNEVFAPFDGIKDLYSEASRYYYHHEDMRRAKRAQLRERRRVAREEQERLNELMEPLPPPQPAVTSNGEGIGKKTE